MWFDIDFSHSLSATAFQVVRNYSTKNMLQSYIVQASNDNCLLFFLLESIKMQVQLEVQKNHMCVIEWTSQCTFWAINYIEMNIILHLNWLRSVRFVFILLHRFEAKNVLNQAKQQLQQIKRCNK